MRLPENIAGRHGMQRIQRIHFVGIGGAGMSGIAEVLINLGYDVSGSDISQNTATARLAELGAVMRQGHHAAHVEGADVVVTSSDVFGQSHHPASPRQISATVRAASSRANDLAAVDIALRVLSSLSSSSCCFRLCGLSAV